MAAYRKEKLEELIKRIIGDTLLSEIKDPRIGFVTIVKVDLSRDYSTADVFVSVLGEENEKKKTLLGLRSATNYIQHVVGKNIRLRTTPRIKFHMDSTVEEGVKLVHKIDQLNKDIEDDNTNQ